MPVSNPPLPPPAEEAFLFQLCLCEAERIRILFKKAALLCVCAVAAHAAEAPDSARAASAPLVMDSASASQTLPLLPERLGPMETLLWSEHGFMRNHFDFPLTEEGREREMGIRRTMLTLHETAGFATLAAMIATCVVGQIAYNRYPRNLSPGFENLKSTLGWTTVGMYFGTAALSVFSPPPLIRRKEWTSVSTHKLLATIHFTGIILTPILATQIADQNSRGHVSRTAETVHMISGYTTTAAFAAAMLVITL